MANQTYRSLTPEDLYYADRSKGSSITQDSIEEFLVIGEYEVAFMTSKMPGHLERLTNMAVAAAIKFRGKNHRDPLPIDLIRPTANVDMKGTE
jgi:hypothetical protein